MDGHYIQGLGDGRSPSEITPVQAALKQADDFLLSAADQALNNNILRVKQLIEGFETPFGMELLATVHWVNTQEGANSVESAIAAIGDWNDRKASLMTPHTVQVAWKRLDEQGWLKD